MKQIHVIDSHTGGEPTRVIVQGGPELGTGSISEKLIRLRENFDEIRSAVVNEPRGSDTLVGGILCEPTDPSFACGIIFFNNTGFLGMCGHGSMGLMVTLKHLGKIDDGRHKIETPVGPIEAEIHGNQVTLENVPSYRYRANVSIEVPGFGTVVGDIAWGGNWFFLVKNTAEKLDFENVRRLTDTTLNIRHALEQGNITGADGALIDHIDLFGEPQDPENDSRNFVLCPGGAYDRSACGTGTSAKVACMAEDNELAPGDLWRQESIVGSLFIGSYQMKNEHVIPSVQGEAFVTGTATLILNSYDPFCMGIRS